MLEAGHRCAILTCRQIGPLQIEHIEDWARVKKHDFENMIVLCANCHGRKGCHRRRSPELDRTARHLTDGEGKRHHLAITSPAAMSSALVMSYSKAHVVALADGVSAAGGVGAVDDVDGVGIFPARPECRRLTPAPHPESRMRGRLPWHETKVSPPSWPGCSGWPRPRATPRPRVCRCRPVVPRAGLTAPATCTTGSAALPPRGRRCTNLPASQGWR